MTIPSSQLHLGSDSKALYLPRLLAFAARKALVCLTFLSALVSAQAMQVSFSEVMYQPLLGKPEFIEVQNLSVTPLDMALWQFTDGVQFTFPDFNPATPQAHFLGPNERILVSSADAAATRAAYPTIPANVRIFGPWSGALDNAGETITLKDKNGVIASSLKYGDSGKWPVQADGAGHSIVLADPNRNTNDWRNWRASTNRGGSPGVADPAVPAAGLSLNEFHFAATGHVDWIEVRNGSRTTTIAGGTMFVASRDDLTDKVAIGENVTPNGISSLNVDFASDLNGDITLYLIDASSNVRDAVKIRRKLNRDSWQVFPAGSREWYSTTTDTRNAENVSPRNTSIVINEIMADPPSGQREAEYIELYNRSAASVNVGGWSLNDAVSLTIPAGTVIPPGGYLVLGASATTLNLTYPGLSAIGNWSGSLGNSGDRIRLHDADGNLVNQVDYRFGGEWPELAGGDGSSLELIHPDADNSVGTAWAASDESAKSIFTSFSINVGTYRDTTKGSTNDDEYRMWLVGDGHLVLKNIVLRPMTGGANVFAHADVTTLTNENVTGWQARGTHWQSFSDAEGIHIIADGHGDDKCNHIEKDASTASGTPGLIVNTAYTLTFDARWVYGKPRLVTQSWDLSIGGTTLIPIPANLGTPGAPNSRLAAAPPPQVTALTNTPIIPPTGSTVTVTARVSSATPLTSVTLFHRLDNIANNANWSTLAMNDSGTGGDQVANDGIYSAQIPLASTSGYNASGAIVQFYVHATSSNGSTTDLPRAGAGQPALWICDNQSSGSDLRRMRVIIPAYWSDALSQDSATGGHTVKFNYKFPKLSNHYFPCTFVLNESEVFHSAGVRKTGSPFTRITANSLDRGKVILPGDRDFRDVGRLYWDNDSGGAMLNNRIVRYWLYLLGVPGNENEVCRITKNNAIFSVRETNESFDKDMLNRIWPNGSDGKFFEMDDAFNIGDDGSTLISNTDASFDYKAGDSQGADNPTAYHNNFTPKTREVDYDYSALISWFKQIENNGGITPEQMERMVDVKAMCAYAAARGYIADWDNITMGRGKNGYFYQRATDQRLMFMHWDSDLGFQSGHIDDAVVGSLTNVGTFYQKPYVRRYLDFYLNQMITIYSPNQPRVSAWLAAEEAASNSYSVANTYASWPTTIGGSGQTRPQVIQTFIGNSTLAATMSITTPVEGATVSTNTVDVNGRAPITAFSVICVGHPEAVFSWSSTNFGDVSLWKLAGIQLASGANVLTFRALAQDGTPVGADLSRTVNRTGDAPPVISIAALPASQNVALGEVATLDASGTYDPESAGPLTYTWTVSPSTGFTSTVVSPTQRQFIFSVPGAYDVTLQVTDAAAQTSTLTRTLSVFSGLDRDEFSSKTLGPYTVQNVEPLDNYSPDAWYSLSEISGSLVLQLTGSVAKPLNPGVPTFPLITRSLPGTTDFTLQTDLTEVNPQIASFVTGLYVETIEGGNIGHYAFGLDGGTFLRVYAASGSNAYTVFGTLQYSGGDVTIRMVRSGLTISFQRRVNGAWTSFYSKTLPAGSTVTTGGLFLSSTVALPQRAAFDYLLVTDPGHSTDLVSNLRVTEIMYQPSGSGVEFIELQNIGNTPINLQGAYFEDGSPWSAQFTFGDLTLQPHAFCVVTNNAALFQTLYGTNVVVAGEALGGLSNSGERITLKDPQGNIILDFSYGAVAPWPVGGTGRSIEVISMNPGSYSTGANWRAGLEANGSPGYLGLATDSDGDGSPDSFEIAFGLDPSAAGGQPTPVITRDPGTGLVTITWPSQINRGYTVQFRDAFNLGWQDLASKTATATTTSYTDSPQAGQPTRFYRVSTQLP